MFYCFIQSTIKSMTCCENELCVTGFMNNVISQSCESPLRALEIDPPGVAFVAVIRPQTGNVTAESNDPFDHSCVYCEAFVNGLCEDCRELNSMRHYEGILSEAPYDLANPGPKVTLFLSTNMKERIYTSLALDVLTLRDCGLVLRLRGNPLMLTTVHNPDCQRGEIIGCPTWVSTDQFSVIMDSLDSGFIYSLLRQLVESMNQTAKAAKRCMKRFSTSTGKETPL
jgi:hypothetical protein